MLAAVAGCQPARGVGADWFQNVPPVLLSTFNSKMRYPAYGPEAAGVPVISCVSDPAETPGFRCAGRACEVRVHQADSAWAAAAPILTASQVAVAATISTVLIERTPVIAVPSHSS